MQIQSAIDRNQLHMRNLEEEMDHDNSVRLIEAFVEKLNFDQLQYKTAEIKKEGCPTYTPKV